MEKESIEKNKEYKSPDKIRIEFPKIDPTICREEKMEEGLQQIKFSEHCFVIYSNPGSPVEIMFTGFNEGVFNNFILAMCYYKPILEFIKLAVISAEEIIKNNKKGMELALDASKYIKEHFESILKIKGG